MSTTDPEEQFETFTEGGTPLGLVPRSRVHRLGLWHRSAQVFLHDASGRLILQRRAAGKDVCPGLWDQSVAEHLKPGESYLDGALRGLAEELGVREAVALEPLGGPYAYRLDDARLGIRDHELKQAFRGCYDGPLELDPAEVADTCAITLMELSRWLDRRPMEFTPWFRHDVVRAGIIAPA